MRLLIRCALLMVVLVLMVGTSDAQVGGYVPARERLTVSNVDDAALYMVQAKRADRVLWSPGGSVLAVVDGVDIDLYRVSDWLAAPVRIRLDQAPTDLAFAPSGQLLYVVVRGGVVGYSTTSGQQVERYALDARRIAVSADGKALVWVAQFGALEVYDLAARTSFRLVDQAEDGVFTPDGRRVLAVLPDKTVRAFDVVTRQPEMGYSSDVAKAAADGALHAVGVSSDGRTLVLPAGDGVAFAAFALGRPEAEPAHLELPASYVRAYGWGMNARAGLLAAAGIGQTPQNSAVLVWLVRGGLPLAVLRHPGVRDAAISPDGTLIASVGGGTLRLWAAGASLLTPEQARALSTLNVVAACNVYGGRPQQGELIGGQSISLVWSWYASTEQQVRDYLDAAQFRLELDGLTVRPWVFVTRTLPDPINDGNPTVYLYAPVGVIGRGSHRSLVEVTWVRQINDGFDDYGPDTANPSDGGACDFVAS